MAKIQENKIGDLTLNDAVVKYSDINLSSEAAFDLSTGDGTLRALSCLISMFNGTVTGLEDEEDEEG